MAAPLPTLSEQLYRAPMRARVVAEAMTWLRTPWHHDARVKGAGVDCAQFLIGVYAAVGIAPAFDLGYYPADWHLHQDRPRFLEELAKYAVPLPENAEPLPGDVAMFKFGRHAAHGSIVLEWPTIIHAYRDEGAVVMSDASRGVLEARHAGCWRLRGLLER